MPTETRSTCPYCGVGCGVVITAERGTITDVRGDPDHPANHGRLCSKGSTLHLGATPAVTLQARLLHPQRRAARGGPVAPIAWDAALDLAADRFAAVVRESGPDAVGFYLSGQLLTEDYYVFNKLAKGVVGTNNVDTNSRLCMSSAVAAYKLTLGADAPPACYDDLALASTLFIAGSNAAWAHPVLFRRIEDARRANPAQKIVVVDPRRTETAAAADLHLAIRPGTDVALFHGMLNAMLREGWIDTAAIAARTTGFGALETVARDWTPARAARVCGIAEQDILQATRWFANPPVVGGAARAPTLSLYCQGLNQSTSGTAKNTALIGLHLATGQIGRPGAGPFSLTGQPNAMGGREVGGMANLLTAHRDLANPAHRAEVARLWAVPDVPARPGLTAVEMFEAAADGVVRALWIACTNPAQSMPDQACVRRALERCEFVVVQEAYGTTATCAYADLLLPATTWGEKDGTVTNSERRISRVRPAVAAPGAARADWAIGVDLARRLEALLHPGRPSGFAYADAESVWNEHRASTRGRDLDITGLDYAQLDTAPQFWPFPEGSRSGTARLYTDGIYPTPDGRARFHAAPYAPVAEPSDTDRPYSLNTGRLRDQWHGMSRSGTIPRLFGHAAEPAVEMHPADMARVGAADGDLVVVTSRRGTLTIPARRSEAQAPAQVFIAMHWGEEYLTGTGPDGAALTGVNALTQPAVCPQSKQPELKHAAVRIARAELPWQVLALAWLPDADAIAAREALRPLLRAFAYASCVPFGRVRSGVLLRAAHPEPLDPELLARIEAVLGLGDAAGARLHYADVRRGQRRTVRIAGTGDASRVEGVLLAGDTRAEAWIRALVQEELPAAAYGRALLAGGGQAPRATPRGRQVCSCHDVTELQISVCAARCTEGGDAALRQVQRELKCGTQCGSCLPELRRLVAAAQASGPGGGGGRRPAAQAEADIVGGAP